MKFPHTDYQGNKLRPALLIAPLPGKYGDWLVCMISSQINQAIDNFDEIVYENSIDYVRSGLKKSSVIRISRLSIVSDDLLFGTTGEIVMHSWRLHILTHHRIVYIDLKPALCCASAMRYLSFI